MEGCTVWHPTGRGGGWASSHWFRGYVVVLAPRLCCCVGSEAMLLCWFRGSVVVWVPRLCQCGFRGYVVVLVPRPCRCVVFYKTYTTWDQRGIYIPRSRGGDGFRGVPDTYHKTSSCAGRPHEMSATPVSTSMRDLPSLVELSRREDQSFVVDFLQGTRHCAGSRDFLLGPSMQDG
eukprot:g44410.t1